MPKENPTLSDDATRCKTAVCWVHTDAICAGYIMPRCFHIHAKKTNYYTKHNMHKIFNRHTDTRQWRETLFTDVCDKCKRRQACRYRLTSKTPKNWLVHKVASSCRLYVILLRGSGLVNLWPWPTFWPRPTFCIQLQSATVLLPCSCALCNSIDSNIGLTGNSLSQLTLHSRYCELSVLAGKDRYIK